MAIFFGGDVYMNDLLLVYVIYLIIIFILTVTNLNYVDVFPVLPKDFYEDTELNWFGCILLSAIVLVIDPWIFVGKFIYWIFHVGRKRK